MKSSFLNEGASFSSTAALTSIASLRFRHAEAMKGSRDNSIKSSSRPSCVQTAGSESTTGFLAEGTCT